MLTAIVDAAIIISNGSDLQFPVSYARSQVPVGLINPSANYLAGHYAASRQTGWAITGGTAYRQLTSPRASCLTP